MSIVLHFRKNHLAESDEISKSLKANHLLPIFTRPEVTTNNIYGEE